MDVIVAVRGREVKTALFLVLNSIPTAEIVATATSTSELVSYCHTFRPEIVIVETGLPGKSLEETLGALAASIPNSRILLIGEPAGMTDDLNVPEFEVFTDVDVLIAALPDQGADA